MAKSTELQGARIRSLRKLKGLTLGQLSQRTGLSQGYLSQIERGISQPSIGSLVSIAQALGVTMQWLFSDPPGKAGKADSRSPEKLVKKDQRISIEYEDGIVDQLLTPRSNNNLEVIYSVYPPGTKSEPYSHKGHEAVTVLQGRLVLIVSGEEFVLEEGDCLSFKSTERHSHRNASDGDTIAIWFITPASF